MDKTGKMSLRIIFNGDLIDRNTDYHKVQQIAKELRITPLKISKASLLKKIQIAIATEKKEVDISTLSITTYQAEKFIEVSDPNLYNASKTLLNSGTVPDLRLIPN